MTTEYKADEFEVIVIGSGMGGILGAAAVDPRIFQYFK